ncbi:hypothetical protein [Streptomyces violaceusniger]|uniref:hypothetical protein n=1 Tax=Streptomyces violaceusniger TaxID=68280 RepID=UPI0036918CEC
MHGKADGDGQPKSGRIELSVAHVAGSALAAIAAAVLASKLGVYGTILGAGVMSVVATAGGTVFQHLFHRTGEQIKEVRVQTGPRRPAGPVTLRRKGAAGEYGEPTTHGTRLRGRRRHVLGALAVFVTAMSVITGIEMYSGGPVSNVWGESRSGTTVSDSVSGSSGSKSTPGPSRPGPAAPSQGPGASRGGGDPAPSPRTSRGGGAADASTTPTPGSSGTSGSGKGSGPESGTGGTTAPATPGPSRTPSGGATAGGTDGSGDATPTPGATGGP